MLRHILTAWLFAFSAVAVAKPANGPFDVTVLPASVGDAPARTVTSGEFDGDFTAFDYREARARGNPFWLKLETRGGESLDGTPSLSVRKGRHLRLRVFDSAGGELSLATTLPEFRGEQTAVFVLPDAPESGRRLYARVEAAGVGAEKLAFNVLPIDELLGWGSEQARMIALAFGALIAMALAALLIFFVMPDRLFILYATLFLLQALYIAYLSGQGFEWPVFSHALPFNAHAWNVPAALSGAAACLFVRDIADLRRYSPRVYRVFGWLAITFVVLAFSNLARLIGLGQVVAAIGNIIFLGTAIFTLLVAFLAWRRGSRAAGWFLLAWGLLEVFTIATTASFLLSDAEPLLYYGLPLSMVAAAILIALGVADRLREQRVALSDAERRARTDPLTGVLNRRSLIERLDAACARAQARG
jgi:hypothetical protein